MDDLAAWLNQQMENQRHTGDALKALAAALPPETGAYLTQVGALLIEDARAKRRILDLHGPYDDFEDCSTCGDVPQVPYPCDTLRLLALPYADRPGYREDWRP